MSNHIRAKRFYTDHNIVGDSEMATRIRKFDWTSTPLGRLEDWPNCLLTSTNLILQSPLPMILLCGTDGYMIYNDAYSVIAGTRHPDALGRKVADSWPEVAGFTRNVMDVVMSGETLQYTDRRLTLHRGNNTPQEAFFDLTYSPVIHERGEIVGVLAIVEETTERVRTRQKQQKAEKRLQEQRGQLEMIFEQAPALIAIISGKNFIVEMANPPFVETFAMGRDIIGKPLFDVLPELKATGAEEYFRQTLEKGEALTGTYGNLWEWQSADGPVERHFKYANIPLTRKANGRPDRIFIHAVDITEQVLSRRQAEGLSLFLEAVLASLPDGIYIAEGDTLTHTNQRGAEVLGYESPDQVPRKISEIFDRIKMRYSEDGKQFKPENSSIALALKGESVVRIGIETTNLLTGQKQIHRTAGAPVRSEDGEIIGAVAINVDLTEIYALQKKVQEEEVQRQLLIEKAGMLKGQNRELRRLAAAKDEFIALTSHQLRTPATGVKQYISMLNQGYAGKLTPEQHEFLDRAYESNEQQLLIIEAILRIAKVDTGKTKLNKQHIDIRELVRSVVNEQQDCVNEHDLTLTTELPSEPIRLDVDPTQMRMAIGNIVDNAIKYTHAGKRIFVRVQRDNNKLVRIDVTDEGVGISAADMGKLFLKFSRITNPLSVNVGGTGLGLYWTKRMIELHGGDITVRSTLRKGTTFTILLPTRQRKPAATPTPARKQHRAEHSTS